jgi:hypothetical protein
MMSVTYFVSLDLQFVRHAHQTSQTPQRLALLDLEVLLGGDLLVLDILHLLGAEVGTALGVVFFAPVAPHRGVAPLAGVVVGDNVVASFSPHVIAHL